MTQRAIERSSRRTADLQQTAPESATARRFPGMRRSPKSALDSKPIPGFDPDPPHPVTRQVRQSARLEGTAGDIMLAARELTKPEGVAATSMAAIARKAGVARAAFIPLLPDKQAVKHAVIEDYLEDLVESVSTWNELGARSAKPPRSRKLRVHAATRAYHRIGRASPDVFRSSRSSACATASRRPSARWWHASKLHRPSAHGVLDHRGSSLIPETFGLLIFAKGDDEGCLTSLTTSLQRLSPKRFALT